MICLFRFDFQVSFIVRNTKILISHSSTTKNLLNSSLAACVSYLYKATLSEQVDHKGDCQGAISRSQLVLF